MDRSLSHPLRAAALLVAAALLPLAAPAPAADLAVKLATLVPEGSVWDRALREMGEEWRRSTDGAVTLRIYPGGVAGDDADIVRKMRIGQLHAGALTVAGLSEIDPAFNALAVPLMFDSFDELFHVIDATEELFRRRLEENGFVLLNWGHGGWAHFFSTEPVRTPDDLRGLPMYTWAGDQRMVEWWKRNDFRPVPLAMTDILTGLQTGMIEALPTTPLAALSLQWFRRTPYMLDLGLAPVVGATIVTRRAWGQLSEEHRDAVLAAARAAGEELEREVPEQDARAVEEMASRGLEVIEVADEATWNRLGREFSSSMRGGMVPVEAFDRVKAARDEYRRRSTGGEPGSGEPDAAAGGDG